MPICFPNKKISIFGFKARFTLEIPIQLNTDTALSEHRTHVTFAPSAGPTRARSDPALAASLEAEMELEDYADLVQEQRVARAIELELSKVQVKEGGLLAHVVPLCHITCSAVARGSSPSFRAESIRASACRAARRRASDTSSPSGREPKASHEAAVVRVR